MLQRDVPIYVEAIGQTRGNTEIEIRARVEGFLETVDFKEGTLVEKGQLLYTIDPRPFEARAGPGQGRAWPRPRRSSRARTRTSCATSRWSRRTRSRAQEYETAVARRRRRPKPSVEAAKAAVEQAQIDLGYTQGDRARRRPGRARPRSTPAPWSAAGRARCSPASRRSDPIHVRFTHPRAGLPLLRAPGGGSAAPDAAAAPTLPFELVLADGSVHPAQGKLVFVDRNVDPRPARSCSRPRSRTRAASCGPGSTRACARRWTSRRARSSCRSARCRSCRASTTWWWSAAGRHGRACAW